jgi:hypothetical protein
MSEKMFIGTDPEFILTDKYGHSVNASTRSFFASSRPWSKIGCDGSGFPAEIRTDPVPIDRIDLMMDDINNTFTKIGRFCKKEKLNMFGGAYKKGYAIGGHLHFGWNKLIFDPRIKKNDIYTKKLIHVLDCYFTPISNYFVDDKQLWKRSNGTSYGNLSAYRKQNYGVEYRTPYSFLLSPLITTGLFSLACLVAKHSQKIKTNDQLKDKVLKYYNNGFSKNKLDNIYKIIKPKILKMMSYSSPNPQHNSRILSLFSLIQQNKKPKTYNIFKNYNLTKKKPTEFTIYYSGNSSHGMRILKGQIDHEIRNKNEGEIDMYDFDDESNSYPIRLTEGMPPIKNIPSTWMIHYIKKQKNELHSIGLSYNVISKLINRKKLLKTITDYLNELKLNV